MRPALVCKDSSLTESAILYQTSSSDTQAHQDDYDPEIQDQYDSDFLLNHPSLKFSSPLTPTDRRSDQEKNRSQSTTSSFDPQELSDSETETTSPTSNPSKDSPPLESSESSHKHHRFPRLLQSRFQAYQSSRQKGRKRAQLKEMVHNNLGSHFRSWFKETSKDGTPILPHQLSKKYTVSDKILGQGSFAIVKTVVEKSTGIERALKIIAKKPLKDGDKEGNMLKEEINILGKVENKNIIKMHDLYETKEGVFIVTDLCKGGELFDRLVEKVHFNELHARHIMRQIFEGVEYLHRHDIIHRDLKPENILLRDEEGEEIVISDFGLSKFIPDDGLLMTACGSPQYVSPEVLLGKGYGPSVDVWSSGVIAYCLLGGYTPFYGEDQPSLFQQILSMKVQFEPEYWSEISDLAKDFIVKCLCPADVRMTAAQALDHPWLSLSTLPPVDSQEVEHKGACLKDGAKRNLELSAKQRLGKAITAVEAVNYLQKLHLLRMDHHEPSSERLNSLQKIVTTIRNHKRGDSLLPSPASSNRADLDHEGFEREVDKSDSSSTVMIAEPEEGLDQAKTPKMNQRMNLDLIVMPVFIPDPPEGLTSSTSSDSNSTQRPSRPNQDQAEANDGRGDKSDTAKAGSAPNQFSGTQALAAAAGVGTPSTEENAVNTPRRRASSVSSETTERPSDNQIPGGSDRAHKLRQENTSAGRGPGSSPSKASSSSSSTKTLNTLLDQYKTNDLPSSARLDPTVEQRVPQKMTLANAWKYVPFLLNQGVSIGSAVASHAFYGPLKKSWGIEMSVFTRILRDAAEHTEFASIAGLQQFFEMSTLLPTPKDGLITPVTFKVKKRNLRGFLKESDEVEDGNRELTGEWVVGKSTWRRLQSDWRSGKNKGKERVILYIHGGAYFVMSAATHRPLTIALSKYTECRVFGINYRLAPDTKFPGALHDCVSAYFRLTDDLGIPPNNIVLGADSAGGGLALALMYYLRDNKYDLPSGAMLFSPWVDLTLSCDSWETNAKFDYLPIPRAGDHMNPVYAYLGENLSKYLTHPYVSPLFGDMKGLPPLLIQCGDAELLRDEVTLLAHKASLAGVAVRHELYEDCVHVFQAFLFLDASRKALQSARHFVRTALDKRGSRISRANSTNPSKANSAAGDSTDVGNDLPDSSLVDDATRAKIDQEMKSQGMINSQGEKVEFRTGEKLNLNPRDGREKAESDNEIEDGDEVDNRDEEQWELSEADSSAARSNEDNVNRKNLASTSSTSFSSSDMRRSSTQPSHSSNSFDSEVSPSSGQSPASSASNPRSSRKVGRTISGSLTTTSLEDARARAAAGMRAQHSGHGAHLSKFHPPTNTNAYRPKIRSRAASQSNPNLEDLMQSYQKDHTSLNTQVWTPDS